MHTHVFLFFFTHNAPVWLQQNAEYLFKHSGGQYSALDMAQYVFWTGDEEGVAKAVEEFIRKGLVSKLDVFSILNDENRLNQFPVFSCI